MRGKKTHFLFRRTCSAAQLGGVAPHENSAYLYCLVVTRLQGFLLVVGLLGAGTTAGRLRESARGVTPPISAAQVTPVGTSAGELTLIAEAQRALSAGNPAKARSALREHAARFPDGRMQVQRDLLEAYTERVDKGTP